MSLNLCYVTALSAFRENQNFKDDDKSLLHVIQSVYMTV